MILAEILARYTGGYNGKDYKVVERFDPRVGIWERVPNMEQSRSYGATAVADGKIFCFGGRQKDKKVCSIVLTCLFLSTLILSDYDISSSIMIMRYFSRLIVTGEICRVLRPQSK